MRDSERSAVLAVEPRSAFVLQHDDEGGDVVDGDLIDPASVGRHSAAGLFADWPGERVCRATALAR